MQHQKRKELLLLLVVGGFLGNRRLCHTQWCRNGVAMVSQWCPDRTCSAVGQSVKSVAAARNIMSKMAPDEPPVARLSNSVEVLFQGVLCQGVLFHISCFIDFMFHVSWMFKDGVAKKTEKMSAMQLHHHPHDPPESVSLCHRSSM